MAGEGHGDRVVVYAEGLHRTGKSTLLRRLEGWRSDRFLYVDRGPWSRWVYYRYAGDQIRTWAMESYLETLRPPHAVLLVTRDLETIHRLQRGEEDFDLPALRRHEELFREALRRFPPSFSHELRNDGGVESLVERAREVLEGVAAEVEGAAGGGEG